VTKKIQLPSNSGACWITREKKLVALRILIVATKSFWSPQRLTGWKTLVNGFSKNVTCPPFLVIEKIRLPSNNGGVWDGNQKNLVAIGHNPIVKWRPKNFGLHSTHPHHWMVIKIFWSPETKNGGCFLP